MDSYVKEEDDGEDEEEDMFMMEVATTVFRWSRGQ